MPGADWLRVYVHRCDYYRWHGQGLAGRGEVCKMQGQCITQKGGDFLYGISGNTTAGNIGGVSGEVVAVPSMIIA